MPSNADIAKAFEEMAALLEITGGNAFRANAYRRAARACESLGEDLCAIALASGAGAVEGLDGIGSGLSSKITEFASTGTMRDLESLRAKVPPGVPALLELEGVGPKTVRQLWTDAGIDSVDALSRALESGALKGLPRIGTEKSLHNLAESVKRHLASAHGPRRFRLGEALPVAEAIAERLARVEGASGAAVAGSARRGRETVGDLDILVTVRDSLAAERVADALVAMDLVGSVIARGPTKCSVRLRQGIQVDVRMVAQESSGAALLYFTGSKEHNVLLRERAISRGMHLNEYGLFEGPARPGEDRGSPIAAATESGIYAALGLPEIPPECREAHGETEWASPPRLLEAGDIRCELHAHTDASDGEMGIAELAELAKSRGFHSIAITDHSRASAQANGLSPERLRAHVDAVREAEAKVGGIRLLAGSEVDILADGRLDYEDDILALLDIVVASPHVALRQDPRAATERLLAAVRHPLVDVLGHPTGRIILGRDGLAPDMRAVASAAAQGGVALEINAHWMRLDLRDAHVRIALECGAMIAVNCDIHERADADNLRYGVMTARRGGLTPDRCVNCLDAHSLARWLSRNRRPTP